MRDSRALADAFHALHAEGQFLILANAWDAGSARLIESLGRRRSPPPAPACRGPGYADGHALPVPTLLATIADIARAIAVPMTTDIEGGFSDDPAAVGRLVGEVIAAGAVGVNLEDGTTSPDAFAAKIRAAKEAGHHAGVNVFVNARTDVFLRGLAPEGVRVDEVLRRARLYRRPGRTGCSSPAPRPMPTWPRWRPARAAAQHHVAAGVPPAARLRALGARRLSAGGAIAQSVWTEAASLARGFLAEGDSDAITRRAMPYAELNLLNSRRG